MQDVSRKKFRAEMKRYLDDVSFNNATYKISSQKCTSDSSSVPILTSQGNLHELLNLMSVFKRASFDLSQFSDFIVKQRNVSATVHLLVQAGIIMVNHLKTSAMNFDVANYFDVIGDTFLNAVKQKDMDSSLYTQIYPLFNNPELKIYNDVSKQISLMDTDVHKFFEMYVLILTGANDKYKLYANPELSQYELDAISVLGYYYRMLFFIMKNNSTIFNDNDNPLDFASSELKAFMK